MTNKVICAEKLKLWAAEQLDYWESRDDVPNSAGIIAIKDLIVEINSDRLSPSPAPAEGVISTVTNCPTCGAECTVEGKTTHYYVPRTAPSAQWIPVSERLPEHKNNYLTSSKTDDDGVMVTTMWFTGKDWMHDGEATYEHSYYCEVTHWQPMPLPPTPTTNTREGM